MDEVYDGIFISGIEAMLAQKRVHAAGVRAVVRLDSGGMDNSRWDEALFEVLHRPMLDGESIPDGRIEEVTAFIHAQVEAEQPVLVHCAMGVSRSVSMVMAYLIEYEGMTLPEAFQTVREGRAEAYPHEAMLRSLIEHYDLPYDPLTVHNPQFISRLASE